MVLTKCRTTYINLAVHTLIKCLTKLFGTSLWFSKCTLRSYGDLNLWWIMSYIYQLINGVQSWYLCSVCKSSMYIFLWKRFYVREKCTKKYQKRYAWCVKFARKWNKTRSIRRTQTPQRLWPLTCDRDLLTRSRPLRLSYISYNVIKLTKKMFIYLGKYFSISIRWYLMSAKK